MPLIFDKFPSLHHAIHFSRRVHRDFDMIDVAIFIDPELAEEHDPGFPGERVPPIVHVERTNDKDAVVELVKAFGGHFAGT